MMPQTIALFGQLHCGEAFAVDCHALFMITTLEVWRAKRNSKKHSMHNQDFSPHARKIGMCYIKINSTSARGGAI
jgi:hypothetical protein